MAALIHQRQSALTTLEQQQAALQKKIDNLKGVPVKAAEFFTEYLQQQEQKNSKRELRYFILGVIVTTFFGILTTIVLHLLRLA